MPSLSLIWVQTAQTSSCTRQSSHKQPIENVLRVGGGEGIGREKGNGGEGWQKQWDVDMTLPSVLTINSIFTEDNTLVRVRERDSPSDQMYSNPDNRKGRIVMNQRPRELCPLGRETHQSGVSTESWMGRSMTSNTQRSWTINQTTPKKQNTKQTTNRTPSQRAYGNTRQQQRAKGKSSGLRDDDDSKAGREHSVATKTLNSRTSVNSCVVFSHFF